VSADVLAAARAVLLASAELDERAPLAFAEPPVRHARSTISVLVANGRRWVVKQPDLDARQEDLSPPVSAAVEFASLVRLDRHFAPCAQRMRVPRPVALLPDASGFVMEYVAGPSVPALLRPARPRPLLHAIEAAGAALAHLHALEPPARVAVDSGLLATGTLTFADEAMAPLGLRLAPAVRAALAEPPSRTVEAAWVRLHGDYAPVNVIVEPSRGVAVIDPSLEATGLPQDDLSRFLTMLYTDRYFLLRPGAGVRAAAAAALLRGYAQQVDPTILRLRLIDCLCRRWVRRQMARLHGVPRLAGARARLVDAQFARLLAGAAAGLADSTVQDGTLAVQPVVRPPAPVHTRGAGRRRAPD